MRIAITLTSSLHVGQAYIDLTRAVATRLATEGYGVVYGGTAYGMMLELATAYTEAGGTSLTGVMSDDLRRVTKGYIAYEGLTTAYNMKTVSERKDQIFSLADAILILPGGYGTLEEAITIIGAKINKLIDTPIVLYNYHGFYDTFINFCDELVQQAFSKIRLSEVVCISDDMDEILRYITEYEAVEVADKFV
jgi:uncharacterized protein (TIGR00730 family)